MTTTVVVGSGSSGAVLAARLSEDESQRVILLEAGPDYPSAAELPAPLRDADAFDPLLFGHDWGFLADPLEPPGAREPIPYLRGRLLGGSGAVNGAVAQRGTREDFERWAAAGNDEWGWDAVLPAYRRLERDLDFGDSPLHGDAGPVPISRAPRADWPPLLRAFEAAALEHGHPLCEDANGLDATGVGPFPRNLAGTLRASSASVYLEPARSRPNLEVRGATSVERVLFDGLTAVAVEARRDGDPAPHRIEADRVVLSAGFVKSPQILMLSGLGPAAQLRELGIEVLVDLPVGETLCDHPAFMLIGFATDTSEPRFGPRAELRYSSPGGPLNDLLVIPALVDPAAMMIEPPPGVRALAMISAAVAKPSSRGTLRLASADPTAQPEIRLNFLSTSEDRKRARAVVRHVHALATQGPMAAEVGPLLTPIPGIDDDEQLDAWLRENVTSSLHGACTARMGPREDQRAVVNQRLAVHGTEGLYVADASVMPEVTTSAVNLTCLLIGERMAQLLRA